MRRHLRIYRVFVASSFQRELEFRANFFAKILQGALWVVFALALVLIVFANTKSIAGWTEPQVLVLTGTAMMVSSASNGLFFSLMDIPSQVRQGTLDFVITKPVDDQFWVSLRRCNFDQFGPFTAAAILVGVGLHSGHVSPTPLQWLLWALLAGCGLAMYYGFSFALMATAIWFVRVDNLWVLIETASSVARTPVDVYPYSIRRFLLFYLPLALLATVPARTLTVGPVWTQVSASLIWAVAALLGSRLFWVYATRHYSSASS